ncbi:cytochrome P450 [Streptomyces mashuensis]|uniref:Cytochrome P450 n=1 Tax=Streptomyces mashuensis TaxID=33904 RepID=A0A919B0G8_9ACTN|nr:cytochrome P450 [Streptomyces mashuensis]GHF37962.1 cytochrome P450 [Streptomyces mashuensis]
MTLSLETPRHPLATALPAASRGENLRFRLGYLLPQYLRAALRTRPYAARLVDRLDPDRRGLEQMRELRARHGSGPVLVRGLLGPALLVLDAQDARKVLDGPVALYAVDTREKTAGYAALQPAALAVSHGRQRTARRAFTDAVLEAGVPVHRLGGHFLRVAGEEARALLGPRAEQGLTPDVIGERVERMGRRCFLGEAGADDGELARLLGALLAEADRALGRPWRPARARRLRRSLMRRQARYVCEADPRSLTGLFRLAPKGPETSPEAQLTSWLAALGIVHTTVVQALALLATHPAQHRLAAEEVATADRCQGMRTAAGYEAMPYVRACVLEAARLWPPVPVQTRRTTAETSWRSAVAPAGTELLVPTAFHARDEERLDHAHRFAPDAWLDGSAVRHRAAHPFGVGEARCSGSELALLLATGFVAEFLRGGELAAAGVRMGPRRPLPVSFDTRRLRIGYRAYRTHRDG